MKTQTWSKKIASPVCRLYFLNRNAIASKKQQDLTFSWCVISHLIKHIRKQINFQKRPEIQFRSTFLKIKNCPSVKMSFFYFKMIMARMSLFTGVDDHFRNQISFLQGFYKNLKKIKL